MIILVLVDNESVHFIYTLGVLNILMCYRLVTVL
jgi:hypothetical protein